MAFRDEGSSDGERDPLDAHDFAYGVFAGEQVIRDGFAEESDFGGGVDIGGGEGEAGVDVEVGDDEVVRGGAENLVAPVIVAVDDLGAAAAGRSGECDTRDGPGFGIGGGPETKSGGGNAQGSLGASRNSRQP